MANFMTAYNIVAGHEGGYQKHPNDSGNYNSLDQLVGTNWGISAPVYEAYLDRPPSESDMRNMSKQTAANIYKSNFWDKIRGDQIQSQAVANIFFDGAVNHGRTGVRIMQRVLGVAVDGIVGPVTLGKLNSFDPAKVYLSYKQARTNFYHQLSREKPRLAVFLQGWLKRINSFTDFTSTAAKGTGIVSILLLLVGIGIMTKKN